MKPSKLLRLIFLSFHSSAIAMSFLNMNALLRSSSPRLFRKQIASSLGTCSNYSPAGSLSMSHKRFFSTDNKKTEELLFERGNEQFTLIRTGLGFSSFHTAYWIWYTTDFVPAVNAANIPELYVDPMLGVTGTLFAAGLQLIFFAWPKRLVSRLTYKPPRQVEGQMIPAQFCIYTHAILGVVPATQPAAVVPVTGNHTLLNPSTSEAKEVLADFSDQLQNYRGYLPIRHPKMSWPPLMLDFRDTSKIPHPDRFLQALLNPKYFVAIDDNESEDYGRRHSAFGRPKESRLRTITKQRQKHQQKRR